jgi:hypothetical protein
LLERLISDSDLISLRHRRRSRPSRGSPGQDRACCATLARQPPCAKSSRVSAISGLGQVCRPCGRHGTLSLRRERYGENALRASALQPTGPCFRPGQPIPSGPTRASAVGRARRLPAASDTDMKAKERHAVGIRRVRLSGVGR